MFIPDFLLKLGNDSPGNRAWLESLPSIVRKVREKWKLKIGDPYTENASCSYVAPCFVDGKKPAVLKIGLPHEEALHEIEGLKLLNGKPTVFLLNSEKEVNAMLLEQCIPGTQLSTIQESSQDEIICALLKEIWEARLTGNKFRPLAKMVSQWNEEAYDALKNFPNPDLAKAGCRLKEALIESTAEPVLLATDLHAGNVLKAKRKPWLAIDIKPYYGDRTYDLTQHLLNCKKRLEVDPHGTINRVAKLAGVDNSRLKDWMFARLASENDGINQDLAIKIKQAPY